MGENMPFVVSLSNHEWPFDKLRANGFGANGLFGFKVIAETHPHRPFWLSRFLTNLLMWTEIREEKARKSNNKLTRRNTPGPNWEVLQFASLKYGTFKCN
jgi:hypothetical protein